MYKSGRSADKMKNAPSKRQSYKNAQFHTKDDAIPMWFWGGVVQNGGDPDFFFY